MNNNFQNPFVNYGKVVHGDYFIGRRNDLRIVENRTIQEGGSGNLAIVGKRRIGKSSLIYKAIMDTKHELNDRKIVPILIDFGANVDIQIPELFCLFVTLCTNELKDLNYYNQEIQNAESKVFNGIQTFTTRFFNIIEYFKKVKHAGFRILFILDEFDRAKDIFKNEVRGFQKLRDLSYYPDREVTYITMSTRSIREIEMQTPGLSNLDQTFLTHYLTVFENEDIKEYFKKFSSCGINISPENEKRVAFYCGGHPYLLEMLGYQIIERYKKEKNVDVDKAASIIERPFLIFYDKLLEQLIEDKSIFKLMQILFGNKSGVKTTDVDQFIKYGIIKSNSCGNYTGYSEHFHNFLIHLNKFMKDELKVKESTNENLLKKIPEFLKIFRDGGN
jgi:hypothetical protein